MSATYSSPAHRAWQPTSRTLGAAFAGSAAMFVAALVQGGSLLPGTDLAPAPAVSDPGTPTSPGGSGAHSQPETGPSPTVATAAPSAPGQPTAWSPGAAPTWSTPLSQLPVRRAPVQTASQVGPAPAATPVWGPASQSHASGGYRSIVQPTATPRTEDSPPSGHLVGGVLGEVGHLADGLGF